MGFPRGTTWLIALLAVALTGVAGAGDVEESEEEGKKDQVDADEPRRGISVADWDLVTDNVLEARHAAWQAERAAFCSSQPSNVNPFAWAHWCSTHFDWNVSPGMLPQELPPAPLPPPTSGSADPLPTSSYFAPRDLGLAGEAYQRERHVGPPPSTPSATLYDQAATPAQAPPPSPPSRGNNGNSSKKR
jgi:hypothetical protein